MKLPSIQQVLQESSRTFKRFPFVLADAIAGTFTVLTIVDYEGPPASSILFKILFASILGFPLLLASALVAEKRGWQKSMALGVQVICVLMLVAYAFSVPSSVPTAPEFHMLRLVMLALALCLMVATAPFVASKQLNGFWHYNRDLVERILLTGVFSLTLYAGLAIAMASVDALFGVDIPGKRYPELGLFILGIFATWFFLSDVPEDLDGLENRMGFPTILRVFGQYILSPMLVVYFVILYAYVVKIAIEWSWPKGMVSGTIFGFASIGMAAYLLLYPIHGKNEYRWIKVAARWFWVVMLPLTVVLQLAIWRRVSEYGITENRYFALGLGLWLAAMAVYFLVSKTKNIKVIPASICVIALLASFGPWGVFSVSESSQGGRLEELLAKNQILIDGKVQKASGQVSRDDAAQIGSIVRYLRSTHGYEQIQPWFSESLRRDSTGIGLVNRDVAFVLNTLGVEDVGIPRSFGGKFRELNADMGRAVNIEAYDHMLLAQRLTAGMPALYHHADGITYSVDSNLTTMTITVLDGGATVDSLQVDLQSLVDTLLTEFGSSDEDGISPERMSLNAVGNHIKLKVILQKIRLRDEGEETKPVAYDAVILYSLTR